MGLLGKRRNRRALAATAGGPEGVGVIRSAEPVGEVSLREAPSTILDYDWNVVGTRAYHLTLEVRLPGSEPYEVSARFEVPKKAENLDLFDTANALKPGIELPVRVSPADSAVVAVDWDRYLASPDRKQGMRAARERGRRTAAAEQLARNPKLQAKMWANSHIAVQAWAGAVQAGQMSRAEFEENVDLAVEGGRMDPAHAAAARRALDSS